MRVLFHPANHGSTSNHAPVDQRSNLPLFNSTSLSSLLGEIESTTRNVGNIIHNEAVAKTFKFDRDRSCCAGLVTMFKKQFHFDQQALSKFLSANFDCLVLSFENLIYVPTSIDKIRDQDAHFNLWCDILEAVQIPIYVFGVGLQEWVNDLTTVGAGLRKFLTLLDSKAALFAVRGEDTERWLHGAGIESAQALGCPSLYVYPDNILSIESPEITHESKVLTSGYLFLKHLKEKDDARVEFIRNMGNCFSSSYVFQNDIYSYNELLDIEGFVDDSSGAVDGMLLKQYYSALGCESMKQEDYWHFRTPAAWRGMAKSKDLYFGDRFHGGVVSLQTGRPAAFIYKDKRVQELTGYCGLPQASLEEVSGLSSDQFLEKTRDLLSEAAIRDFKDVYVERLDKYNKVCLENGLVRPLSNADGYKKRVSFTITRRPVENEKEGVTQRIQSAMDIYARSSTPLALELVVIALMDEGLKDEAVDTFRTFLAETGFIDNSKYSSAFFRMSKHFDRNGCKSTALYSARLAYRSNSDDSKICLQYGSLLNKAGCSRTSVALFEKMIGKFPDNLEYRLQLILAHKAGPELDYQVSQLSAMTKTEKQEERVSHVLKKVKVA